MCWPEELVRLLTDNRVGKYEYYDHDHKQQHTREPWEVEKTADNDRTATAKPDVLIVAQPKIQVFWGVTLCSSQPSQKLWYINLQGQELHEDEVIIILQNVRNYWPNNIVPHPERPEFWIAQWHFISCHYHTVTMPGLCTAFQLATGGCTAMKHQHTKSIFLENETAGHENQKLISCKILNTLVKICYTSWIVCNYEFILCILKNSY